MLRRPATFGFRSSFVGLMLRKRNGLGTESPAQDKVDGEGVGVATSIDVFHTEPSTKLHRALDVQDRVLLLDIRVLRIALFQEEVGCLLRRQKVKGAVDLDALE